MLWRGLCHSLVVHQKNRGNGFPLSPWRMKNQMEKPPTSKGTFELWVSKAVMAFSFSSYSTGQINIFVFYYQVTVRWSLPTLSESLFSPQQGKTPLPAWGWQQRKGGSFGGGWQQAAPRPSHYRRGLGEAVPFPNLSIFFPQDLNVLWNVEYRGKNTWKLYVNIKYVFAQNIQQLPLDGILVLRN